MYHKPRNQNGFNQSISPHSRKPSPKTPQHTKNHIAINGYNNQIAIGGNNVVLNLNVNQLFKPKTPIQNVIYKHLNINEIQDRKNQTPQNRIQNKAPSNHPSKQHSRNNSKLSTPAVEESDWDQVNLYSQVSFAKDKKRMISPKMMAAFTQSQMNSRNTSQHKRSPSNQSRNASVEYDIKQSQTLTRQQMTMTVEKPMKQLYNLQYVIGIGGFGKVWKVQHKKSLKIFALKEMNKALVLTKKSVNSVLNERTLLSQLKHQFLVNMHCAFQDRENLYLVMDFLSGGDLRYHIGRNRKFNEEQTRFFIACIIVSLEYLHTNQIIHRDIKPENLVLDSRGYVRVTDLGIARLMRAENSSDTSGTPGYMAPEVMCRLNHTYSVDYFALGVIAYEFMLGKRPYLGRSRKEIRDQILARQVQIKGAEIPDQWSLESIDFVNKLLQRKPQNRLGYNGAQELKAHPWLKGFPWQKLLKKELQSPYLPNAKEDNFDSRQISLEDEENNELIKENILMLRRNSVQNLFEGYSFDGGNQQTDAPSMSTGTHRKNSLSTYTQAGPQPSIQQNKLFFNNIDSLLRTSYMQKQ